VVSKISLSAGEGISNGILLARIGYGVMAACRPLPMRVKRGSFIRGMVSSIKETMTDKGEKQHGKTV
jgi:putative membrane protein